jgi:hypothetical protein
MPEPAMALQPACCALGTMPQQAVRSAQDDLLVVASGLPAEPASGRRRADRRLDEQLGESSRVGAP